MNKNYFIIILILLSLSVQAQWTNTGDNFTTRKLGLGTSNPQYGLLHLSGDGASMGINLWTKSGEMTSRIWIDVPNKLLHISRGANPIKGITIDNDGKIGIGTSNPDMLMTLDGGIGFYRNNSSSTNFSIGFLKYEDGFILGNSSTNDPLRLQTNSLDRLTIKNNGKIGIGTNNPEYGMLQIYGDGPSEGITLWTGQGELTSRIWTDVANKYLHISRGNDPLKGLTLDNNGNLSIGTVENGSHKLAVEGTIGAREIKVEANGWSDFVFESTYELRPLEEVENYINKNKHLPDVPSNAEVTKNGINLGEMDAKLLQKIEELTLYLIEQNKKIEKLQKKVMALKK